MIDCGLRLIPRYHHYCHTITTVTPSLLSHHHYYHTITTITPSLLSHPHTVSILTADSPTVILSDDVSTGPVMDLVSLWSEYRRVADELVL